MSAGHPGDNLMTNDKATPPPGLPEEAGGWTVSSNHTQMLVCLARDPQLRLREVAAQVGITEGAVQRIIAELERAGIITRQRRDRANQNRIQGEQHLCHPLEAHRTVGALLDSMVPEEAHRSATGTTG